MKPPPWVLQPASKLALRLYLIGVVQFVIVMSGMVGIITFRERRPFPFADTLKFVSGTIADSGGDPQQLAKVMARLQAALRCPVAIYDGADQLVSHDQFSRPPVNRNQLKSLPRDLTALVPMPGGATWYLVLLEAPLAPPLKVFLYWVAFVSVVVGAFSVFIARKLVRPLARLVTAAHDFGAGKLEARVRMDPSDVLGEVASAFDQMADRMTYALRVEKELLANVSHELRTPLQRIHIAVELAAEGDAATARESMRDIAEDLAELERIVEDVLTATRLSLREGNTTATNTASPPIRPESADLRALLAKSTTRFRAAHPKRQLHVAIAEDLPVLSVDPVLLRRVVDNLLDNAHKYTEDPYAEISLFAGWWSNTVVIEVRDRGSGIAASDLGSIFQPFFRADRSRTRTTGGLGLGLALARRIVDAHEGKLTIESVEGAGTTARIELPIKPPPD